MNESELLTRLQSIEFDDFEVKEAKSDLPKNIWETVCAFANTSGGWIVLGVLIVVLKWTFRIQVSAILICSLCIRTDGV